MTYTEAFVLGITFQLQLEGWGVEIPAQTFELFSGTQEAEIVLLCPYADLHGSD